MTILLAFGDSITQGFWDIEGGWVQRLRKDLQRKNIESKDYSDYFSVHNLGISGDKSDDLVRRFEPETKERLRDREEDEEVVIIFAIGSNDATFNNKTKKNDVPVKEFEKNISKLISLARKHSSEVIFTEIPPVDEEKVDPIPWLQECSYQNEFMIKYNEVLRRVCEGNGIKLIKLYDHFRRQNYRELLEDGCHPNSEGHKLIFEIVRDFLINEKII